MKTVWRYVVGSCVLGVLVVWVAFSGVDVDERGGGVKAPVPTKDYELNCVKVEVEKGGEVGGEYEERTGDWGLLALKSAINAVKHQRPDGKGGGGRWEGTYGPVVIMTYAACHGAASQHYGHLSAMTVAKMVKPDIVILPHARTRNTYRSRNLLGNQTTNSTDATEWEEIPLSAVYDTRTFQEFLGEDIKVVGFPLKPGKVVLPANFTGFERHWVTDKNKKFGLNATMVEIKYKRRRPGWVWREIINRSILPYWRRQLVIVDLGCTDIMVGANPGKKFGGVMKEDMEHLKTAHQTLKLAPYIVKMGRETVTAMRRISPVYTGLHLRLERDMIADKSLNRWTFAYLKAKEYFLNSKTAYPLFIASGVFEYMSPSELEQTLKPYSDTHVIYHICTSSPLPNDVRPWLDYIALSEADYFQGHDYSSLSWLVVQQRNMKGFPLSTSSLVRKTTPALNPTCCENDRCLTTTCTSSNGTVVDYANATVEVAFELPPVVLDVQVG